MGKEENEGKVILQHEEVEGRGGAKDHFSLEKRQCVVREC
jgi:hypothetical protein